MISGYAQSVKAIARVLPRPLKDFIKKYYAPYVGVAIGETVIPAARMLIMLDIIKGIIEEQVEGDLLECGVYKGGSALAMGQLLKNMNSNKKLYAIDTFEGFPFHSREDYTSDDRLFVKKGLLSDTSYEEVKRVLRKKRVESNVVLLRGKFSDVFPNLRKKKFCFALVDCDLYKSYLECIKFIKPRLSKGGGMLFDDYNHFKTPGATKAVNKYFKKSQLLILPKHQAYYFKK